MTFALTALPRDVFVSTLMSLPLKEVVPLRRVSRGWGRHIDLSIRFSALQFFEKFVRESARHISLLNEDSLSRVRLLKANQALSSFRLDPSASLPQIQNAISQLMLQLDETPADTPFNFSDENPVKDLEVYPVLTFKCAERDPLKLFEALKVALHFWHPKGVYSALYELDTVPTDPIPLNPFLTPYFKKWAVKEALSGTVNNTSIATRAAASLRVKAYAEAFEETPLLSFEHKVKLVEHSRNAEFIAALPSGKLKGNVLLLGHGGRSITFSQPLDSASHSIFQEDQISSDILIFLTTVWGVSVVGIAVASIAYSTEENSATRTILMVSCMANFVITCVGIQCAIRRYRLYREHSRNFLFV